MKINIFWFRRDLRLEDNTALNKAVTEDLPVLPVFIFDTKITDELPVDDARITFIYENLSSLNDKLSGMGSSLCIKKGDPEIIWKELIARYDINEVFVNKDYEPYATERDNKIEKILKIHGIGFRRFKDQVIFEENEILKSDSRPYTIFTPYKNKWLKKLNVKELSDNVPVIKQFAFYSSDIRFPSPENLGFSPAGIHARPFNLSVITDYHKYRDYPAADSTSYLSPHLRFGTVSIRNICKTAFRMNLIFLNELIWREFFMQILFHFPEVVTENFKCLYDDIQWRNNEKEFLRWCTGETGYPIVDAGMRQLNETGYMHNRVRMITAGFLCKHLLIDWRWGEAYFARRLLDYELSSNNGNWQWAAGTGCDAAPYFRIFNPSSQEKRFDQNGEYVRSWVPEYGNSCYPEKIVDHEFARQRALQTYRSGIKRKVL
jgi:deoxyribodipyrimidine photo-lyase